MPMKNLFLILLLFFIAGCSSKEADIKIYQSYPRYEVVVDEFFKEYSFPSNPEGEYYRFAKTKKGYEILIFSYDNDTEKESGRDLFWSLEENKFTDPGKRYHHNENYEMREQQKGYHSYQGYSYNRMIYFGYKGCEDDIIEELEDAENLTDTLMESLARAYGGKANEIATEIYNSRTDRKPTSEEISQFTAYINKEGELYKKIMDINPAYQCLVGRVDVKLGHQFMHGFYTMDLWGEENGKNEFLSKVSYGKFMENYAENVLTSCKKNAILFTYGDGDTYPLWYVQEKKGFRKDVAIINTSLLNLPDYIQYVKRKYGLKMQLKESDYNKSELDAVFLNESTSQPAEIDSFLQALKNPEALLNNNSYGEKRKLIVLEINTFKLTVREMTNSADTTLVKSDVILFKRRSLYKSEIAQLDIIANNFPVRTVYFTGGETQHGWDRSLNVYLDNSGLVAELTPYMEKISMYNARINVPLQYELLMKKFRFDISTKNGFEAEPIVSNYLYSFTGLANFLLDKNETEKAEKVLDRCLQVIPLKELDNYAGEMLLGMAYLKIENRHKEAEKLFNQCLDKMEKELKENDADKERMNSFLSSMISQLAIIPIGKKLSDRAEALKESLENSLVKY